VAKRKARSRENNARVVEREIWALRRMMMIMMAFRMSGINEWQ